MPGHLLRQTGRERAVTMAAYKRSEESLASSICDGYVENRSTMSNHLEEAKQLLKDERGGPQCHAG
jgi:hypothetical protein